MNQFNLAAIHFAWLPILPMITVAIAAMGVLLAGVRVDDEESEGLGWLTLAALGIAFIFALGLVGQSGMAFSGAIAIDGFSAFFRTRHPDCRRLHRADLARLRRQASPPRRRILLAAAVLRARDDADGDGGRPDHHLPGPGDDVDRGLCAGRNRARRRALQRSRHQVLPARRVLDRFPALRNRAGVRRHRHYQAGRHPRRDFGPHDDQSDAAAGASE